MDQRQGLVQYFLQNVRDAFRVYDTNSDGRISKLEVINQLRLYANNQLPPEVIADYLFQRFDRNRDGFLTIQEIQGIDTNVTSTNITRNNISSTLAQGIREVTGVPMQIINQAIQSYRFRENGKCYKDELFGILGVVGYPRHFPVASDLVNKIFGKLDKNKDGVITVGEVEVQSNVDDILVKEAQKLTGIAEVYVKQALERTYFRNKETATRDEIANFFANVGYDKASFVNRSLVNTLFQNLDKNRDGVINISDITPNVLPPNVIANPPIIVNTNWATLNLTETSLKVNMNIAYRFVESHDNPRLPSSWTVNEMNTYKNSFVREIGEGWNNKVTLRVIGRANSVPLEFNVVESNANINWTVIFSKQNTYRSNVGGNTVRLDSNDQNDSFLAVSITFNTIAHEFGHMIQNPDEYGPNHGGIVRPHNNDLRSIMNIGYDIRPRHINPIIQAMAGRVQIVVERINNAAAMNRPLRTMMR